MPDTHDPQVNSSPTPPAQPAGIPHTSDSFGTVPPASASFRTVRNDSESFRIAPNTSERKENHILTVREVARMFEVAGVARTERSIVKWCRRVGNEVPRLDSYFDPNERKYYITPQSVELAIAEERAKAAKVNAPSEPVGSVPNASDRDPRAARSSEATNDEIKSFEHQIRDLQITNRAKDMFIERLEKERESFAIERQGYVEKLMNFNRRVGELETQLLQLAEPGVRSVRKLEVRDGTASHRKSDSGLV